MPSDFRLGIHHLLLLPTITRIKPAQQAGGAIFGDISASRSVSRRVSSLPIGNREQLAFEIEVVEINGQGSSQDSAAHRAPPLRSSAVILAIGVTLFAFWRIGSPVQAINDQRHL